MIPFLDLKAQHRVLKAELMEAASRVIDSCQFALGNEVAAFEEEFAAHCGAKFAAGVNTGTSALHLALLAAGIGAGDEVITVSHTFMATVSSVRYAGAKPVFVDVDPVSYTMDPKLIEAAITKSTKAIMPVHLYGQPADMDPHPRDRQEAQPGRHRGRVPGPRRRVQGPPRRQHRPHGGVQLLPRQEPGRLRRGRGVRHERPRAQQEGAHAPRLGAGEALPPRDGGVQLPDGTTSRARSFASS